METYRNEVVPVEMITQLLSGFSEKMVYVAIGIVTFIGLVKCIYPVLRNGSLLNHAVIKLEKSASTGDRPVWKEPRFLGRSMWGEWQKFLLNAGQLDLRGMPCNLEEYINEDTVVYKPGHAQLAELIPSLLTSLGILGTFMGMMEGLSGVNFTDAAGTIQSIPTLLAGMRFAFATSVAGISCSLVFNMLNRIMVGRAFKALDLFDEAFYELVMPRPLDPEVQLLCQKQDEEARMQRMAESIGSHVAGALEMAVGRAMHPLTLSVDNFVKGASQEQIDGIRKVVNQFVQQMNMTLDGQISSLGETMRLVNQGQMQTQQNLQQSLHAAEMMVEEARRIQEATRDVAKRMDELSKAMFATQEIHLAQAEEIKAQNEPLRQETEILAASMAQMQAAMDAFTHRVEEAYGEGTLKSASALWEEDAPPKWAEPETEPRKEKGKASTLFTRGLEA